MFAWAFWREVFCGVELRKIIINRKNSELFINIKNFTVYCSLSLCITDRPCKFFIFVNSLINIFKNNPKN